MPAPHFEPFGPPAPIKTAVMVHVGPHKTGTTWLQQQVLAKARGIEPCLDSNKTHRAFLTPNFRQFAVDKVANIFADNIASAEQQSIPLVMSDEALGGYAFAHKYLREVAAFRVRAAFPEAKILLTIRQQDKLLASLYCEYLRNGHSACLRDFISQETFHPNVEPFLDVSFYKWDRVIRFYRELFGEDRVLALPMEWMVANPGGSIRKLEEFLGKPLRLGPEEIDTRPERPSLSGWALTTLRIANRFHAQDVRTRKPQGFLSPNSLAYRVDRITPRWARRRSKQRALRTIETLIGEHFRESNRECARLTNFDLAELGYRV